MTGAGDRDVWDIVSFFFSYFTFFLAKSTFTIRTSTTTMNGHLLHVIITHTCTRTNRTRDATLLDPKVCFFLFFFFFFLILLTIFYKSPQSVNWPPPQPLFPPPQASNEHKPATTLTTRPPVLAEHFCLTWIHGAVPSRPSSFWDFLWARHHEFSDFAFISVSLIWLCLCCFFLSNLNL